MSEDLNKGSVPDSTVGNSQMSAETPVKSTESWSKKQKFILNIFAVLGLLNMIAYFVTQNSFVAQNIYWVYGIVTFIDAVSALVSYAIWDDYSKHHFHKKMPARIKNAIAVMVLWLLSIPVITLAYFLPSISISLIDVANYAWGTSLVMSGFYDTLYVIVVAGSWIFEGVPIE